MAEIDDLINELEKAKKKGITEVYFGTDIEGNDICMGCDIAIEEGSVIIYPDTHEKLHYGLDIATKIVKAWKKKQALVKRKNIISPLDKFFYP